MTPSSADDCFFTVTPCFCTSCGSLDSATCTRLLTLTVSMSGEGAVAADRHYQFGCATPNNLEHRGDCGERQTRGSRSVPQDPSRLCLSTGRVPASDDRR